MRKSNINESQSFWLPDSEQILVFMPSVLETFAACRQLQNEPEGGGLIFAEFELPRVRVCAVTTPHRTDRRWRTLFIPNRVLQRKAIASYFKEGFHFIGEWHTHPEPEPSPSTMDLHSMQEAFIKSKHELNYFIMVIVGNTKERLSLWVSAHCRSHFERLAEYHCV